jgi:hypothetical protein
VALTATASLVRSFLSRGPVDGLRGLARTFSELGWRPILLETSDHGAAVSLAAGGHPQLLIAPARADNRARSVSLGYSHESVLTLDWGPDSLSVHRSAGWKSIPGDDPLLQVTSHDATGVAQVLNAVSRDRFEALAAEATKGRHPPLADLLARAFAEFRRQVAESELLGGGPGELAALRLFHQLLFMRFHEDRFGVSHDIRVGRALETDDLPRQLARGLEWYSRRFNSELFADIVDPTRVPQRALIGVIRQLVEPWERLHLDFSVTTNEVAGRLYQSYLRLAPARVDEGRLFPGAELRSRQKQHGAYYTPAPVARFLVRETLTTWLRTNQPASFDEVRVVDPACGSGAFLVAAYRELLRYWEDRSGGPLSEDERARILSSSIFGIDEDVAAVMLCRIHLLEEASLAAHNLPELSVNIVAGDSLTGGGVPEGMLTSQSYDIVVTNPPFAAPRLATLKAEIPMVLERFESLRGTGRNLAYAFAELAAGLVRDRGRAGLLVPRALLDGPSSAAGRKALGGHQFIEVLDFGRNVVFDYTLAYVAAVVMAPPGPGSLVAARLRDNLVSKIDLLDDLDQLELFESSAKTDALTTFVRTSSEHLSESDSWAPFTLRWRLDLKSELAVTMDARGTRRAPVVLIGTQTGADERFVIESRSYSTARGQVVVNDLAIPERLAPLWIKGEDILPFRVKVTGRRVIIPQEREHPSVDAYIARHGGVPASFFPGQLDQLRQPKVLVRNMFLEPAAVADITGGFLPPQGVVTAIVPPSGSQRSVLLIEALLNSSLYQWLLQGLAHPRTGGFGRLMLHHWNDVPWPRLSPPDRRRILRAGNEVRRVLAVAPEREQGARSKVADTYWRARHQLDEAVLDALGASDRLRTVISGELWRLA